MNWKDSLISSKLSAKITVKSLLLVLILSSVVFSQQDTTSKENSDTVFVMAKSPWFAVLQSAVVPGLGQIYNESYIKAPVIWGAAALLVYGWVYNNNKYSDFGKLYQQYPNDPYTSYYKKSRDFYRDQRDLFTIYMGLLYFLNLVDAYVDAQLFDFNVTDGPINNSTMLNLRINF
jgi:Family of unknown function (DUF5683)